MHKLLSIYKLLLLCICITPVVSCKKILSIPEPRNTVTDAQVFETDLQAEGALAGLYTHMIHGTGTASDLQLWGESGWAAGLTTIVGGLSSGDFIDASGGANLGYRALSGNNLNLTNSNPSANLWNSAYKTIYLCNAIIEGIAKSESNSLTEKGRKVYTAEAKMVRAFTYFYLTNLYGDLPLALTVDFHQILSVAKSPQSKIYEQILADLKAARIDLPEDFAASLSEKVRPNKWVATAILARVYLYLKDYPNAEAMASEVIAQHTLFSLETNLSNAFRSTSKEAIWQLKQTNQNTNLGNATLEGFALVPSLLGNSIVNLTSHLINSFEHGDLRRTKWVDSFDLVSGGQPAVRTYFPGKYKIGSPNKFTTQWKEYYILLRLPEMYLIRAEARAYGAGGGLGDAIDDLNLIRKRADLSELEEDLGQADVLDAILAERQHEYFGEWGHRWLDLKRTGKATEVMLTIPHKNPWAGDYQLLYPIPPYETEKNIKLTQNPGYII